MNAQFTEDYAKQNGTNLQIRGIASLDIGYIKHLRVIAPDKPTASVEVYLVSDDGSGTLAPTDKPCVVYTDIPNGVSVPLPAGLRVVFRGNNTAPHTSRGRACVIVSLQGPVSYRVYGSKIALAAT
jgi:hypothetical protein